MTSLFTSDPWIVAEVGSNFRDFNDCKNSIQMAKSCGADAVKFQMFDEAEMYGQSPSGVPHKMAQIKAWLPRLKEKADAAGIEFMCTAFSVEGLAIVDQYVEVHKIASSDLSYTKLLKAAAKTMKPILLSTGGSSKGDVHRALDIIGAAASARGGDSGALRAGNSQVVLMYCASAYPSRMHNLFQMDYLRETFGKPVGLSDHSLDVVYAPLSAVRHHKAVAIEKHFTVIPEVNTPDRDHSLDVEQFKYMVDQIRNKVKPIGHAPTPEEKDMILKHNRRLIVTSPIKAGEFFMDGKNFGAYRSLKQDTHGLNGFEADFITGKAAAKDMAVGDPIGPGDFV